MSMDETVSFSLEVNVEKAFQNIRRLQTVLYRSISLARRLGLPEDIEEGIVRVQSLIAYLNALRLALIAVHMASGPIGWALAGIGIAGVAVSTYEMTQIDARTGNY